MFLEVQIRLRGKTRLGKARLSANVGQRANVLPDLAAGRGVCKAVQIRTARPILRTTQPTTAAGSRRSEIVAAARRPAAAAAAARRLALYVREPWPTGRDVGALSAMGREGRA